MHPVEVWWAELEELSDNAYPSGVCPVREHVRGTAFFSGGAGLYIDDPDRPLPPIPVGGVMFVGHNLDAEAPFGERVRSGRAHGDKRWPMRTWLNLYTLLDGAEIDPRECFFTNAYVGLKAGTGAVGPFAGSTDPAFSQWCRAFLDRQIEYMRPRAIVPLGAESRRFLGWPDRQPGVVEVAGRSTRYVCLAHPSMHPANVAQRGGVAGEIDRLRAVAG